MDFTRKDYDDIKKMDRRQMETYIRGIHKNGKQEGFSEAVNMQRKHSAKTAEELIIDLEEGKCPGIMKITVSKVKKYAAASGFIKGV